MKHDTAFAWVGDGLYRHRGKFYHRAYRNGKRTWLSTGKDTIKEAREWVKQFREGKFALRRGYESPNLALVQKQVTAGKLIDDYVEAGCPTKKMRAKAPESVQREQRFLRVARSYFADAAASSITVGDCDEYRAWRQKGGYVARFTLRGHDQTKHTRGGNRTVDLELSALSAALNFGVRRRVLKINPLAGRPHYTSAADVRHCREFAPTPEGLRMIEGWLRNEGEHAKDKIEPDKFVHVAASVEHEIADAVCFMAYSGLRIGETLPLRWDAVNLGEGILQVKREKKGVNPWVAILPEMEALLLDMETRRNSDLLFPSPFDATTPRDASAVGHRLAAACKKLKLPHVRPHGLRSYFVTQARQSGLTDAEIAALIGDKTGPAIIAHTYGDLRPDHLLAQAKRIRLTAAESENHDAERSTIRSTVVAGCSTQRVNASDEKKHAQVAAGTSDVFDVELLASTESYAR